MRFFSLGVLLGTLLLGASSVDGSLFLGNVVTGLDFKNFESIQVDVDGDGLLDVGDSLRGVWQLQNNSLGINGTVVDSFLPGNGAGNPEVTGIFEVLVLGKFANTTIAGTWNYVFGPSPTFATAFTLPTNTMLAVYTDPVFEYSQTIDDTTKTVTDVYNVITDGSEAFAVGFGTSRLKFGAGDTFGDTQTGDGYWYATAASEDLTNVGTSTFYYGLEVLAGFGNYLPSNFLPLRNTQQVLPGLTFDKNDLVGRGNTSANLPDLGNSLGSQQKFDVASNDPAGVFYVPEPGSSLCWLGLMAAALTWVRRRRKG
jgi:hypothetical protein